MYRLKSTGELKTKAEIRKSYPNKSFPHVWTTSMCKELGIDEVLETVKPIAKDSTKMIVLAGVEQNLNKRWEKTWKEVDRFKDIVGGASKVDQDIAYAAQELKATQEKEKNSLLTLTELDKRIAALENLREVK